MHPLKACSWAGFSIFTLFSASQSWSYGESYFDLREGERREREEGGREGGRGGRERERDLSLQLSEKGPDEGEERDAVDGE